MYFQLKLQYFAILGSVPGGGSDHRRRRRCHQRRRRGLPGRDRHTRQGQAQRGMDLAQSHQAGL
jgi:hypothetical protein